ncbi:uncharacterized protein N7458_010310 [Penicillium daleae]|uniref:Uncharacterized protein n=1 Tax=Penicillium daleae TaxID=63821 RepID=A0AAD6C0A0_9EURO|nr:uncharacterized protein N7458_010310 [Penicillium daleae]KAJ5439312.1 hypothetical protein N7458_010310 [Penicillium daleae]
MAAFEINKPKFLVNCGAFDRYLNDAPSGVLTLPAYERNADDEVIVHVGEVFCRVPDCEHGKKAFQKTVGLREHLKKAHSQDGFAPVTLKAGNLDKATKDAAKAFFNGLYSRGASQATPVAAAPAKRPLPLKRGGEVNKGEVLRILGLNARKDIPCAACKAADLPKRCIFNKAICDHLATFDIPEES